MPAGRTTARFALATALVAAISLGGSVATASAEEVEGLYSASEIEGTAAFVQLSKTDATATPLPVTTTEDVFYSIEIVAGVGYAIGVRYGAEGAETYTVYSWDVATGAVLTAVPITSSAGTVSSVWAMDATVGGTLLLYVRIGDGEATVDWIASIDPATGATTLLVNLDDVDDGRIFEGLATNPVSGITYALADYDDGYPAYSPVDLAAGTVGPSETLQGIYDSIGAGWISEGDFDSSGVLWFTRGDAVNRTVAPTTVAVEAELLGEPDIQGKAIAIGNAAPTVPAGLAATGFEVAPLLMLGAALLAAGALALVARRRAQA